MCVGAKRAPSLEDLPDYPEPDGDSHEEISDIMPDECDTADDVAEKMPDVLMPEEIDLQSDQESLNEESYRCIDLEDDNTAIEDNAFSECIAISESDSEAHAPQFILEGLPEYPEMSDTDEEILNSSLVVQKREQVVVSQTHGASTALVCSQAVASVSLPSVPGFVTNTLESAGQPAAILASAQHKRRRLVTKSADAISIVSRSASKPAPSADSFLNTKVTPVASVSNAALDVQPCAGFEKVKISVFMQRGYQQVKLIYWRVRHEKYLICVRAERLGGLERARKFFEWCLELVKVGADKEALRQAASSVIAHGSAVSGSSSFSF